MVILDDPVRQLVRTRLTALKLNMAEVSKAIGKNPAYLQQYLERGVPRSLPEDIRDDLAGKLGVQPEDLKGIPAKRGRRNAQPPSMSASKTVFGDDAPGSDEVQRMMQLFMAASAADRLAAMLRLQHPGLLSTSSEQQGLYDALSLTKTERDYLDMLATGLSLRDPNVKAFVEADIEALAMGESLKESLKRPLNALERVAMMQRYLQRRVLERAEEPKIKTVKSETSPRERRK